MAGVNDNLIPPKKGEVRNPKGKPKGTKHISTWIQTMLHDEEFETILTDAQKGALEYKGAPIQAIIKTAIHKALHDADKGQQWAEWLAKHGYGTRQTIELHNPAKDVLEAAGLLEGDDDREADTNSQGPPDSPA